MNPADLKNKRLAKKLVLDELFDLTLYKRLHGFSDGEAKSILEKLIPMEEGHLAFWQKFFGLENLTTLDFSRKAKLFFVVLFCRLAGEAGIHLALESIEIHGIRKYLKIWKLYQGTPLEGAVKGVLEDEFKHEDIIISESVRKRIHPERVRDIFLGFNDGLVEILGAVAGFFAAFQSAASVLIAGLTVAVAGSISMAAGAYAALSSSKEVGKLEKEKARFFGKDDETPDGVSAMSSGAIVGIFYFIGAMVPVLPVLFGAKTAFPSIIAGGIAAVIISYILAVLSGMMARKRILMNLIIITIAVSATYAIGSAVKIYFGIEL